MSKSLTSKKAKSILRRRKRRKGREWIIRYHREASLFSTNLIGLNFGDKYNEMSRYISEQWRQGRRALVIAGHTEGVTEAYCYSSEKFSLHAATMDATLRHRLDPCLAGLTLELGRNSVDDLLSLVTS